MIIKHSSRAIKRNMALISNMSIATALWAVVLILCAMPQLVQCHGYLSYPPARNSDWECRQCLNAGTGSLNVTTKVATLPISLLILHVGAVYTVYFWKLNYYNCFNFRWSTLWKWRWFYARNVWQCAGWTSELECSWIASRYLCARTDLWHCRRFDR